MSAKSASKGEAEDREAEADAGERREGTGNGAMIIAGDRNCR
jgi:hypothetical protein